MDRPGAGRPRVVRLSGASSRAVANRAREREVAAGVGGQVGQRGRRRNRDAVDVAGARRADGELPPRIERRHADARVAGARSDHPAEDPAARRTVRRTRRAHAIPSAGSAARSTRAIRPAICLRHAFDLRGGVSRRSCITDGSHWPDRYRSGPSTSPIAISRSN